MSKTQLMRSVLASGIANKLPTTMRYYGGLSSIQTHKIRDIFSRNGILKKRTGDKLVSAGGIESLHWQLEYPSTSVGSPYSTAPTPTKKKEVHYEDLLDLIHKGDLQLIDVREPREVENGQIPTSINIPLPQLKYSLQLPVELYNAQFGTKRSAQPSGDDLVFYGLCNVKGITALEIAFRLGLRKARHYPGGYEEWCMRQGLKM